MLTKSQVFDLLSGHPNLPRWTQSSPIRPDVWFDYIKRRGAGTSLLLTPRRGVQPGRLYETLSPAIRRGYNQSVVCANPNFSALLREILPLSSWWRVNRDTLQHCGNAFCKDHNLESLTSDAHYFLRAVGLIEQLGDGNGEPTYNEVSQLCEDGEGLVETALDLLSKTSVKSAALSDSLYAVSKNRPALIASKMSRATIKADAAERVFDLKFDKLTWAVIDSGIEATHPAFGYPNDTADEDSIPLAKSRVIATYDFTRLGTIMDLASSPSSEDRRQLQSEFQLTSAEARDLGRRLTSGRSIDWDLLKRAVLVDDPAANAPQHPHGTHVAGILGGCGKIKKGEIDSDDASAGVCPDIKLVDVRVLNDKGKGDEFQIITALQFIRHINEGKDLPVIQGVNLSLQMLHDVREYACGRTPVCDECERLVASGVVVVAAAGNRGFSASGPSVGFLEDDLAGVVVGGYEGISITDPGNADAVITVGSTHRSHPHSYGVSFFSSRGPTGDGRAKPDLLAPGEKILGPVLNGGYDNMDGTSQAAPHVSGAAAMLMARHRELIGRPQAIKESLMANATNLGRIPDFQGKGLVDALRALESH